MTHRSPLRLLAGAGAVAVLAALAGTAAAGPAPISAPKYRNYEAPAGIANSAGEPSVGVNWKTGAVFFQAGLQTDKVVFDKANNATWTNVAPVQTRLTSLDPFLHTDNVNGRVFVSQLTGLNSLTAFTDDDGATYSPSQGGGIPSGVDHQSLGSGPYPKGGVARPLTAFPHAVYYCSQSLLTAFCARSDTGGATFGAGSPLFTLDECGALHGHVRVSPDGTVYVPNSDCDRKQGFAVSTDAGLTWTNRTVPESRAGISDPSVAAGKDNTAYFGYVDGDGRPKVAVTRDRGLTFSEPFDVGAALGVQNAAFPAVIAGDGTRAAIAFLGTTTAGDAQADDFGKDGDIYTGATYHLYIATTYDRGRHWTTVKATGSNPVQRGKICQGGTFGCGEFDRNLLDFMDIDVDQQGRVLVGWADGCTNDCVTSNAVTDNRFSEKGVITRQSGGTSLFARSVASPVVARPAGPRARPAPARPGRELAATGLTAALPLVGLGLLIVAVVVRRRRTA